MITIDIVALPPKAGQDHQQWQAWLDDELLCTAREPLLSAARVLLARGASPDETLTMRHRDADHVSLISTVGKAAKLAVTDKDGPPRFTKFRAYPNP